MCRMRGRERAKTQSNYPCSPRIGPAGPYEAGSSRLGKEVCPFIRSGLGSQGYLL